LKKLLLLFGIVILSIGVKDLPVSAEKQHKHDSQGMEQAMDHYILSQFHDEMMQAINDYYKKEVRVQYNWWDKNYDVVEIDQFEKAVIVNIVVVFCYFSILKEFHKSSSLIKATALRLVSGDLNRKEKRISIQISRK
jgi:hypothetical protein